MAELVGPAEPDASGLTPSAAYAAALSLIVDALIDNDQAALEAAYTGLPLTPQRSAPRAAIGDVQKNRIYRRDHYQCLYCGRKLVLSDVLALLNRMDPTRFPWHRNWKTGSIHPTFPMTIPTVDHVRPVVLGGTNEDRNLVTACWPCNQRKGDLPLTLPLIEPADVTWCGLTDRFRALWIQAGEPPEYLRTLRVYTSPPGQ